MRPGDRWRLPLLSAAGLALGLLLCDQVLAPRLLPPAEFFVKPPGATILREAAEGVLPGVHGPAINRYTTDGLRCDPYDAADRYRILCIGGSTTECEVLDHDETWSQVLQTKLRAAAPDLHPWVGNASASGINSRHHILLQTHVVPRIPACDAVIHLLGFNDFAFRLAAGDDFATLLPEQVLTDAACLDRAFAVYPGRGADLPWYKKTNTWRVGQQVRHALARRAAAPELAGATRYDYARQLALLQEHRQQIPALTELPDLSDSLAEFERNLRYLIALCQRQGVRLILLTQPTLWRRDLSDAERRRVTFGNVGRDPFRATAYYAPEALAKGMAQYNAVTLRVADATGVECLDLAALIPKDLSSFYDDCHFNEAGAVRVANAIASYLRSRPPFAASLASASSSATAAGGSGPETSR